MNPLQSKLSELNEEQKIRLYNNVFGSLEGQLVLEDLKMRAFFYVSTADKSATTPTAAFASEIILNEGARRLLLEIIRMSEPLSAEEVKPKGGSDGADEGNSVPGGSGG
jgi:hypothetical protein